MNGQDEVGQHPLALAAAMGLAEGVSWQSRASCRADARISLKIAPDRMEAVIEAYYPAGEGGADLSIPLVMQNLLQHGIVQGLCREGMIELFRRVKRGESPAGIVLAQGIPARPAVNAGLEPLGDLAYPVFPGDAIIALAPGAPYKMGKDVCGGEVDNVNLRRSFSRTLSYELVTGCHAEVERGVIVADRYGLVRLVENSVSIIPLHRVSEDCMSISLVVYPRDFMAEPPTLSRLRRALLPLQTAMPCASEALERAIGEAVKTGMPVESEAVVVGRMPVHGEDGRLSFSDLEIVQLPGRDNEMLGMAGRVRIARPGQRIGHLLPPSDGTPGMDVFGHAIAPHPGQPVVIVAGENVRPDYSDNAFYALQKGAVILEQNRIAVRPLRLVREDLGQKQQAGESDCCMVINGSIICGAEVEGVSNLIVGAGVEDVNCGVRGDISLHGGVCMNPASGRTITCHNLFARYAVNARIVAERDVILHAELSNSIVRAGGRIEVVKGKGLLRGGVVSAGTAVRVRELGSPMCVRTLVIAGAGENYQENVLKLIGGLQREIEFINDYMDLLEFDAGMQNAQGEGRSCYVRHRLMMRRMLGTLQRKIELVRGGKIRPQPEIVVEHRVYPGVVLGFYATRMEIERDMGPTRFWYDDSEGRIRHEHLHHKA